MSTAPDIAIQFEDLMRVAANALADAAPLVRQLDGLSQEQAREHVGDAILHICEARIALYAAWPELDSREPR